MCCTYYLENMQNNLLIIFSRPAVPGKVKKRLARELGQEQALRIHQRLFRHTQKVAAAAGFPVKTYLSAEPPTAVNFAFSLQRGRGLGERMLNCFADALSPVTQVCLIGSDCPELTPEILARAFTSLHHNDLVLGPAHDGGYYLIGMKKLYPELFSGIAWGTDKVLEDTLQLCAAHNISCHLLPTLHDIDHAKDVPPGWL